MPTQLPTKLDTPRNVATAKYDAAQLQSIDDQIQALGAEIVRLRSQTHGNIFAVADGGGPTLQAGYGVALNGTGSMQTLVLATAQNIAAGAVPCGITTTPIAPGTPGNIATAGILSASVVGSLAGSGSFLRANPSTGRIERVAALAPNDVQFGFVRGDGSLVVAVDVCRSRAKIVDATCYGAVADGVTLNDTAVANAIAAAPAGAVLYLPGPGTYLFGSTVVVNKQLTLRGDGETNTIIKANADSFYVISLQADGCIVESLRVSGAATTGTEPHALQIGIATLNSSPAKKCKIRHVTVENIHDGIFGEVGCDDWEIESFFIDRPWGASGVSRGYGILATGVARWKIHTGYIKATPSGTITGATNASPIVISQASHGLVSGDYVQISGVVGNTAANGSFAVTVVDANTYSLNGSTGNGAYVSGGKTQARGRHGVYFTDGCVDCEVAADVTIDGMYASSVAIGSNGSQPANTGIKILAHIINEQANDGGYTPAGAVELFGKVSGCIIEPHIENCLQYGVVVQDFALGGLCTDNIIGAGCKMKGVGLAGVYLVGAVRTKVKPGPMIDIGTQGVGNDAGVELYVDAVSNQVCVDCDIDVTVTASGAVKHRAHVFLATNSGHEHQRTRIRSAGTLGLVSPGDVNIEGTGTEATATASLVDRIFVHDASGPDPAGAISVAMANANHTLIASEWCRRTIKATGAHTAVRDLVAPTTFGWAALIINGTTSGDSVSPDINGYPVRVKTAAGSGVYVAPGTQRFVLCDGTNIVALHPARELGSYRAGSSAIELRGFSGTNVAQTGATQITDIFMESGQGPTPIRFGDALTTLHRNAGKFVLKNAADVVSVQYGVLLVQEFGGTIYQVADFVAAPG